MNDQINEEDNLISVVVLGKGVVGKTSLIYRVVNNSFPDAHDATIEDKYKTFVEIDGETREIQIVDTAGEEDYQNMLDQWVEMADGFILVFAINDMDTFNALQEKIKRIQKHQDKKCPIVLVGNKCDLEDQRKVSKQDAEALAKSINAVYVETSALTDINKNCKLPFVKCAKNVLALRKKEGAKELADIDNIVRNDGTVSRRGQCCSLF